MKYLLDSNIVSAFADNTNIYHNHVIDKLSRLNDNDKLYISILTLFEFEYSFFCCLDEKKKESIRITINSIKSIFARIEISEDEAKTFGEIKSFIKNITGTSPKNMRRLNFDIMIASTAISHECVIVSGDKIFETISKVCSKLHFENWLINK